MACGPGGREDDDGTNPPPVIDGSVGDPDGSGPPPGGPPYPDFPAAPIVDGNPPANAAEIFAAPNMQTVAGPCLTEPQLGTLFPNAFLRPRFNLAASGGQNLFEIRIHAADEINDLVVYTTKTQWTMPSDVWAKMSLHLVDKPITVTVRGATYSGGTVTSGPALGSSGDFSIAPVAAGGTIVYWTTSDGNNPNGSALKAFDIGNENVRVVLRPQNAGLDPQKGCIGCHVSTPDGKYLAFADAVDPNLTPGNLIDGRPGYVDLRTPPTSETSAEAERPPADILSPTAITLLARKNQHVPSFSGAHWRAGDRVALTMFQANAGGDYAGATDIIWTDLEAMSTMEGVGWGKISRVGDAKSAAAAAFSHDGTRIAYVSGSNVDSGARNSYGDIYMVPYNNRLGGAAAAVPGASDPGVNESYPSFSADDQLLTFTRSNHSGVPHSYNNPTAEVFVVGVNGGPAVRLKANDPPTCGGQGSSPGITNSWPRWSPGPIENVDGRKYYWLAFSSRRGGFNHPPQIYVAPIVMTESGIETYPAIYLWNQPANEANHTPAWDNLQVN